MSITVSLRTPLRVHSVEVRGDDTLLSLYKKSAKAACMAQETFTLHYEGAELEEDGNKEIAGFGFVDGCDVLLKESYAMNVRMHEILENRECIMEIRERVKSDPDLLVVVDVSDAEDGVLDLTLVLFNVASITRHLKVIDILGGVTTIADMRVMPHEAWMYIFPSTLTVSFSLPGVTRVGNNFLSGDCTVVSGAEVNVLVVSADLTGLPNLASVGDRFLAVNPGLTHVGLPPSLRDVGGDFLRCNSALISVDLTPLRGIEVIGNASADLNNLRGVKHIGHFFLSHSALTAIDLAPLCGVVSIGDAFLSGTRITSVDVAPLAGAESIGERFLEGCELLTEVDLSPLGHLLTRGRDKQKCCCIV